MSERAPGEQTITTWAETQQQLLSSWVNAWRGFDGTPDGTAWRRTVEAWQTSVKATLEAQNQWIHEWSDALTSAPGTPEQIRTWAQLSLKQLDYWIQAQQKMWEDWLDRVKDIEPAPTSSEARQKAKQTTAAQSGPFVDAGQSVMQYWQDSMREMLNMQAEWTRRWMEIAGGR